MDANKWNFMGVHRLWTVLLLMGCLVFIPTGIALATRKSGWGYFLIILCILALAIALVVTERARVRYLENSIESAQTLIEARQRVQEAHKRRREMANEMRRGRDRDGE